MTHEARTTLIAPSMRIGTRTFVWATRTYLMGVINVSPDSFSGDGLASVDAAVEQARRFVDEGADILDVGGQSTRPGTNKTDAGFDEIAPEEEIRRVVPVIERLRAALPEVPISVDTYKPDVARAAHRGGGAHAQQHLGLPARCVALAQIAAEARVPAVVMHNQRGRAADDVMAACIDGLRESMRIAAASGVDASMLIADPGFGFGWRPEQNMEMLRRLAELRTLGLPILVGTSRKSTIGTVLGGAPVESASSGRRQASPSPSRMAPTSCVCRRLGDEAGGAGRRRDRPRSARRR